MSFELILPFLRPIEPLLLDEASAKSWAIPTPRGGTNATASCSKKQTISFDAGKLRTGLEVIANQLGKKLDEDNPFLHAQLPDGSRLAAVIPPVVRSAPALTIRKFTSRHYTVDDLIARGTLTRRLADFLAEQIRSGKTLLSVAEPGPERPRYCGYWPTLFRNMNASLSSRTPPNFRSRSRTLCRPNARPILSRPRSLSTTF